MKNQSFYISTAAIAAHKQSYNAKNSNISTKFTVNHHDIEKVEPPMSVIL